MCHILEEMGLLVDSASPLGIDNQSALSVVKNPEHHGRMKHLDLRYYWLHGVVEHKLIAISFVPSENMTADILTKALTPELTDRHCLSMGLL